MSLKQSDRGTSPISNQEAEVGSQSIGKNLRKSSFVLPCWKHLPRRDLSLLDCAASTLSGANQFGRRKGWILRPNFDWKNIREAHLVEDVLNHYGTADRSPLSRMWQSWSRDPRGAGGLMATRYSIFKPWASATVIYSRLRSTMKTS